MNDPLSPAPRAQLFAAIGLYAGCVLFLVALWQGMSIDPRVNMHGRMICYSASMAGLFVIMACLWSGATHRTQRVLYGISTVLSFGLLIYQLSQTL